MAAYFELEKVSDLRTHDRFPSRIAWLAALVGIDQLIMPEARLVDKNEDALASMRVLPELVGRRGSCGGSTLHFIGFPVTNEDSSAIGAPAGNGGGTAFPKPL